MKILLYKNNEDSLMLETEESFTYWINIWKPTNGVHTIDELNENRLYSSIAIKNNYPYANKAIELLCLALDKELKIKTALELLKAGKENGIKVNLGLYEKYLIKK